MCRPALQKSCLAAGVSAQQLLLHSRPHPPVPLSAAAAISTWHRSKAPQMRSIGDYGIIGNGRTAALVGRDGSIDWCCWPRFDSPAVFCRLLDVHRGGFFRIEPTAPYRVTRRYTERSNILATSFQTADGQVRVSDFMPAPSQHDGKRVFPHRILRKLEGVTGRVELEVELHPTFDYARSRAAFAIGSAGAIAHSGKEALSLVCPVPLGESRGALVGRQTLAEGESLWLILTHGPVADAGEQLRFSEADADVEFSRTIDYWKQWMDACRYDGPYKELVQRSALLLKLLIFEPTGALVAAPTTSLPEAIGGVRNWDYRYAWLRDSGLILDVLQQLGYHDESLRFIDWLEEVYAQWDDDLQILYAVDGQAVPEEELLNHLAGHRGSRPVRIGNRAGGQTQRDAEGHVVDAVVLCLERMPRPVRPELWNVLRQLANRAASGWREADQGPWEISGEPRHFLYSKLYCWVALDRAVRLAQRIGLEGDLQRWRREQKAIRETILAEGYCEKVGAFTQSLGSTTLDASVLTIPLVGFLPATDPRMLSTVDQIRRQLGRGSLLYRYLDDDGLPGREGSFSLCSFWLVSNLAQAGRVQEAREAFEQVCGHANDLGLLAEEIDPASGELLGNFPQGFTHLGLVHAALHIVEAERAG